ncbi:MAG: glycerophosphodiester phosphodiesterase [Acidimicrobiia bacterium]|nr:glycerophosphodiester phosphodiesterase [Acidimicrobiia bacterium]
MTADRTRFGPAVFGHRGGDGGPENSLEAIRSAIEAGADGVEIDLQVGPAGRVAVGHDPIDWSTSRAHSIGLAELLSVVDKGGIDLLIDFKSTGDPLAEAIIMAEALTAAARPEAILVSSFNVAFLRHLRELAPELVLCPIVSLRQNFPRPVDHERWDGFSVLAAALINPFYLRQSAAGRRLFVWFAATEWSWLIRLIARWRVDGVVVSDIGRTVKLLAR